MRLYALFQAGDPEAIDVYLAEADTQHGWRGLLRVEEVELSGASESAN
jgi:hypothetical protein